MMNSIVKLYILLKHILNHLIYFGVVVARHFLHYFDMPEQDSKEVYPTFRAISTKPSKAYLYIYTVLILMIITFVSWATFFEVDAYVHARGEVETFSKTNKLTMPNARIIDKIHVKEGDTVKAGQLLITFDRISEEAANTSIESLYFSNLANLERIEAQIEESPLVISKGIVDYSIKIADDAYNRYNNDTRTYLDGLNIISEKINQKQTQINKISDQIIVHGEKVSLIQEQVDVLKSLEEKQLVTKLRLLEAQKELADDQILLDSLISDLPRAQSELQELKISKSQFINNYKKDLTGELNVEYNKHAQLKAQLTDSSSKLSRSEIFSPINAIVHRIPNTTKSSSIQPGEEIISLVPIEDSLIISANVRPEDIGLLTIGQEASVKITAYDYAIYGLLKAKVHQISPETFENASDNNKPYFKIELITDTNYLTHHNKKHYISPGMVAMTDIMVDRRTVMQYVLNPFIKTVRESLTEK